MTSRFQWLDLLNICYKCSGLQAQQAAGLLISRTEVFKPATGWQLVVRN